MKFFICVIYISNKHNLFPDTMSLQYTKYAGGRAFRKSYRKKRRTCSKGGKKYAKKSLRRRNRRYSRGGNLSSSSFSETPGVPTTSSNGVHFLANNPKYTPFQ